LSTATAKAPGVPGLNTVDSACEELWTVACVSEFIRAIRVRAPSSLATSAVASTPDAVDEETVPVEDEEGVTGDWEDWDEVVETTVEVEVDAVVSEEEVEQAVGPATVAGERLVLRLRNCQYGELEIGQS
jgi:hypothetical protein